MIRGRTVVNGPPPPRGLDYVIVMRTAKGAVPFNYDDLKQENLMEVLREFDVQRFLTLGGQVFLSSQFDAVWNVEHGDGGSSPDIVALDFGMKEIVIVEVTTASSISNLLAKVEDRQTRWYAPIRRSFGKMQYFPQDWTMRFLGFVRKNAVEGATRRFSGQDDVAFLLAGKRYLRLGFLARTRGRWPSAITLSALLTGAGLADAQAKAGRCAAREHFATTKAAPAISGSRAQNYSARCRFPRSR